MTYPDAMKLLNEKVAELGQAEVARRLEVSAAAISQMMSGKYQAAPDNILKRVIEIFGGLSVECPVLGTIPLSRCAQERKKGYIGGNGLEVRRFKACPDCENNR